ncbi:hypothetical protein BS78_04G098400 [Paspalum vaginatum]|nr:hypothetical protein BS78_04G098400 [Paspalum vaginatum]
MHCIMLRAFASPRPGSRWARHTSFVLLPARDLGRLRRHGRAPRPGPKCCRRDGGARVPRAPPPVPTQRTCAGVSPDPACAVATGDKDGVAVTERLREKP